MDDGYESVLFVGRECFVYRIPPRAASAGYRAAEWGNLEAYIWKGRLRIVSRDETCEIRMEDSETGDLFASAPYDVSGSSVEAVLDSSRYFVLRVESPDPNNSSKKRRAYLGMGFQDRGDAFDFNVALQDWTKRVKRIQAAREAEIWAREHPEQAAAAASSGTDGDPDLATGPSPHLPTGPKPDLSLKEGQTFAINIPGGTGGRRRATGEGENGSGSDLLNLNFSAPPPARSQASGTGLGGGLLPPPPSRKR